ncbi:MAG TPA: sugar phosphate isomerase/epimerase family protein [Blastocatellia bacterium]|nr:sugar phosphate isomerase/epimerase family protein [Blastocatellia bacterium]
MSRITRRTFIHSLSASIAAPAIIRAIGNAKRLPIGFSTLGCPNWEWKTILEQAARHGFAAIEMRGLTGEMDLSQSPQFTGAKLNESLKDMAALELKISGLGASTNLHEPEAGKRAKQMDEAKRFIELAHRLSAPYVRVFPNQLVKGEERKTTIDRIVTGLRELGDHAKGSGVEVIVESHGEFTTSPPLLEIIQGAAHPNVAFLWDAHHTCVAGEKPAETFKQLGRYVRHTHLKDSRAPKGDEKGRRYVLTGSGEVPVKETVKVLAAGGYRGYYSFEWEKKWHPEIEEPEIAIPHYAKVMRQYLAEAGIKA